jgi:hypothetical protein
MLAITVLMLLGGCSQKEFSDGANDIGNDIKRVIKGEN